MVYDLELAGDVVSQRKGALVCEGVLQVNQINIGLSRSKPDWLSTD